MIGRYQNLTVYKEIVASNDFSRILLSAILIGASFLVKAFAVKHSLLIAQILLALSLLPTALPIVLGSLKGIFKKRMNVDELVSIAIIASVITGHFLEAAMVSAIMVAGELIEELASDKARNSIKKLVEISPEQAAILKDGKEQSVLVKDLKVDDILILRPGDLLAVDAEILEGEASFDESSITGESIPVAKKEGDLVFAGSINSTGYLKVKALKVGKDSTLGKIISLVLKAEAEKVNSSKIVDRYAQFFTPVILLIAALTFIISKDINKAITVLIVGCPCSFLLSGPVPTVAAIARAAKAGVLVKGGIYLEKIARAQAVFFDKTGTLTKGEPKVNKIISKSAFSEEQLLYYSASLEQSNRHPIAKAILEKAYEQQIKLSEPKNMNLLPGIGVKGFLEDKNIYLKASTAKREESQSVVDIFIDHKLAGFIYISDSLRDSSYPSISQIKKLGISDIAIVSGDHPKTVLSIAKKLGIKQTYAGLKPHEKYKIIEENQNKNLIYVGDGINDAPALKKADIAVAMGAKGSDIALEAADIVLMNDHLELLPFLILLSKKMIKIIKSNIFMSFSINFLSVIAGFLGILTPIWGALTHNLGSILVLSLSLTLALQKEKQNTDKINGNSSKTIQYDSGVL